MTDETLYKNDGNYSAIIAANSGYVKCSTDWRVLYA